MSSGGATCRSHGGSARPKGQERHTDLVGHLAFLPVCFEGLPTRPAALDPVVAAVPLVHLDALDPQLFVVVIADRHQAKRERRDQERDARAESPQDGTHETFTVRLTLLGG